jgi:hypothetical protein
MSNVVFILGAGCSKQCGAPLVIDFLDIARDLYLTNKVGEKAPYFEKVFKAIGALQSVYSKSQLDLINIESVFNALEVARILNKFPDFEPNEISEIIKSLKEVIVTTLEKTVAFPVHNNIISAPFAYAAFAELVNYILLDAFPQRTVSIITFNYDIAIDVAFFRRRLKVDYGLDTMIDHKVIPLLKLHGSLNWSSTIDDNKIIPLTIEEFFKSYKYDNGGRNSDCYIGIGSLLSGYFSKNTAFKVKEEPVIVPPTWNKIEYYQTISKVWSNAAKELSEAEYIFIIGYSLPETDAFFRFLYALGTIGSAPLRKIEVFNPDGNVETKKRFESLMGSGAISRFKYIPQDFSQSLQIIHNYFPMK